MNVCGCGSACGFVGVNVCGCGSACESACDFVGVEVVIVLQLVGWCMHLCQIVARSVEFIQLHIQLRCCGRKSRGACASSSSETADSGCSLSAHKPFR